MCRAGWCGPGLKRSELPLPLRFTTRTTSLYFLWNLPDFVPLCWAVVRRHTHTQTHTHTCTHTPEGGCPVHAWHKFLPRPKTSESVSPSPQAQHTTIPLRISHFLGLHWRGRTNLTPYCIWFFLLLTFAFYCFCYQLIIKGVLSTA